MRVKILVLGLICLFVFAFCTSPEDPEIEKALNPGIEEGATTKIRFTFRQDICCCERYPEELADLDWYGIFDIYINDGIGTYGDGLLIHTHEFGRREGAFYYELPERYYSFIPDIMFPGTRERYLNRPNTEFDFEFWFYLKESNIPSEFMDKVRPYFFLNLVPLEQDFDCFPEDIATGCVDWQVGERTDKLRFRVMIGPDW